MWIELAWENKTNEASYSKLIIERLVNSKYATQRKNPSEILARKTFLFHSNVIEWTVFNDSIKAQAKWIHF
jgi:hypothetical protein